VKRAFVWLLAVACLSSCGGVTAASPTPPPTYRESVLSDQPAGYWPMNESSGNVMADASGNGHDGSYEGTVSLGQPGAMAMHGSAAVGLDRQGGWATIPDAPTLELDTITIELWINKRSEVEYGAYVTKNFSPGDRAGTGWFELLNHHHSGPIEFRVTEDNGTLASATSLALNTWYYVVASYDGTTARLYINGKLDSSIPITAVPKQSTSPIYIGRRADGLFNSALLSELAIYPRALSADRIAAHWQSASVKR
jgi:Concanavalin A-like lectin/glucanases superfamily